MSDPHRYPYAAPSPWDLAPDCPHVAPRSCRKCDGSASDEWAMKRIAEERLNETRLRTRLRMRRDRAYRKWWLRGINSAHRAMFAEVADRMHGPMPGLLDEIEEGE